jgi:hypothetical protein
MFATADSVTDILKEYGLQPERLVIELNESMKDTSLIAMELHEAAKQLVSGRKGAS